MKLTIKRDESKNSDSTDREMTEYIEARRAVAEAKSRMEHATKNLVEKMTREQRKSFALTDGGKTFKATYVQNTQIKVNEQGLKKALGAVAFRKVCKQVLDRKALEEAMSTGTVDPVVVGQYVTEEHSAPFIRFTEGTASDESSPATNE